MFDGNICLTPNFFYQVCATKLGATGKLGLI